MAKSSSQLKHIKRIAIINKIYNTYDAMHSVNVSQEIEGVSREIILDVLRKEIEIAKSTLSLIERSSDEDSEDLDDDLQKFAFLTHHDWYDLNLCRYNFKLDLASRICE